MSKVTRNEYKRTKPKTKVNNGKEKLPLQSKLIIAAVITLIVAIASYNMIKGQLSESNVESVKGTPAVVSGITGKVVMVSTSTDGDTLVRLVDDGRYEAYYNLVDKGKGIYLEKGTNVEVWGTDDYRKKAITVLDGPNKGKEGYVHFLDIKSLESTNE